MMLNLRNIVLFSFTLVLPFVLAVTAYGFKNEVAIVEQDVVDTLNEKGDVSVIIILREDIVSFSLAKSPKNSINLGVQVGTNLGVNIGFTK
jgi:hypothetical protein